ncbi:MAG: sigma-70 family RNA polymerase sigma factor [Planctomycetota bacterium]
MSQISTHVTLLRALAEDENADAWDEFVQRYGSLIQGVARRQGLPAQDCDDVVQDVLMALTGNMKRFEYDPSKGKFRAYLKTISLRAVFARFRQKHRDQAQGDVEDATSPLAQALETSWEEEWRQYHLRRAMAHIEPEFSDLDVAAFRAYAVEQRDAKRVSDALGISLDRVYQAKSRFLKRLRERVTEQIEEEG